jgi:hypothetical protein
VVRSSLAPGPSGERAGAHSNASLKNGGPCQIGLKVSGRFKGGGAWRLVSGNRFRLRDIDVMRAGDPSQAFKTLTQPE